MLITRITQLILIYGLSNPISSQAAETDSAAAPLILEAKPRICVTVSDQPQCSMITDIIWRSVVNADYCLFSSEQNNLLKCWRDADSGLLNQTINSDKAITYWLSKPGENRKLIQVVVHVVTVPPKNIRRRRRHIWSLL